MRGIPFKDTNIYVTQSILMSHYHQPYSEIDDIPYKTVEFLIRLYEAEKEYEKREMDKLTRKIPKRGRKI